MEFIKSDYNHRVLIQSPCSFGMDRPGIYFAFNFEIISFIVFISLINFTSSCLLITVDSSSSCPWGSFQSRSCVLSLKPNDPTKSRGTKNGMKWIRMEVIILTIHNIANYDSHRMCDDNKQKCYARYLRYVSATTLFQCKSALGEVVGRLVGPRATILCWFNSFSLLALQRRHLQFFAVSRFEMKCSCSHADSTGIRFCCILGQQ